MARSPVDILQVQTLPWSLGLGEARHDVQVRTLSHDPVTGARSDLLRYPAGWNRQTAEHLTVDEEFYVLDGTLEINGFRYRPDNYAYLPAGFERRHAASEEGAVVLTFFSGAPKARPGRGTPDLSRWVGRIDPYVTIWSPDPQGLAVEAELKAGARVKLLREDPVTKAQTFLVGFVAVWRDERQLEAATDLEAYLLGGDCTLAGRGVMRQGAYACRPRGTRFGPQGSLTPTVMLVRSAAGPYRVVEHGRTTVDLDVSAKSPGGPNNQPTADNPAW
ncbi:MAG: hypothetical protein FJX65_12295 [Alphaproteobacteria bacterium]|nr:hypothetical protein [Alphaproteobacteria bacterium]